MESNDLWTTKYEAKTLDEIIGQKELVAAFKSYVKNRFIPNMTLGGAPGVGKTLIIKCFAHDLGIDQEPGQFEILNASDDRGIDMVRTTLRNMAEKPRMNGGDLPKLICLDEGDAITSDAQGAMRALIQNCSDNARFILTGNYPEEFIAAINSRCPLKVVAPLTKEDATIMIKRIQEKEKFEITQDAIDALFEKSDGDMRLLMNTLQDAAMCSNFNIQRMHVITTEVKIETVKKIIEMALTNYVEARQIMVTTYQSTKDADEILRKMYDASYFVPLTQNPENNEIMQRRLRDRITEIDFRLTQKGINIFIQLDGLLNYIKLLTFIPLQCSKVK
jgi:replication factor C small subunit